MNKWLRISVIFSLPLLTNFLCHAQERMMIPLNNNWQFTFHDLENERADTAKAHWSSVRIPHTWNNTDIQSGEKVHYGTALYKKELILDTIDPGKQYFLKFEGVGQKATVSINNEYVGEHLGSYSAFAFNISRFLRSDTTNIILVKVNNELNLSYPKDNFLFGIYGGIYREVQLIMTDNLHLGITDHASSGVYIHPKKVNIDTALLEIVSMLKNDGPHMQTVTLAHRLYSGDSDLAAENEIQIDLFPGGQVPVSSMLEVNNPHLWNGKKDPHLYQLETTVIHDGEIIDQIVQATGIRYFSIDPDSGFILNGKPYRLYGICRHQEWQDLGNALLPEHHRKDMALIHEMGATSIRLAHYQQASEMYALADSLGILVWAEIPFVNGYLEGADGNALQQLTELIKQNSNHPSIFVWGVHNEVIKGKVIQPAVNLTNQLHILAKDLDPSRPTVAVSNIWWVYDHPIHELTDLQGYNQYTGWYGGKPEGLGNWIKKYHTSKPDVRFSVSEYGAGGNIIQQSSDVVTVPDPTGQFFPEGFQTHYHETTWSAIEQSPFIWASYIWNMFDFSVPEWNRGGIKGRNHKGLITYDRQTKKDAFFWYKANWSEEPVFHLVGKRNNVLDPGPYLVKAYCNFGIPELFVDGVSVGKMEKGVNGVQFIKNIQAGTGEHHIEIRVEYEGEVFLEHLKLTVQ